jgi:ferredoxin
MKHLRYLENVATLKLDTAKCIGCTMCAEVCPHGVLVMEGRKACIIDVDGCMECGACANNCPTDAIALTPGVGCAGYIIQSWFKGKEKTSCGISGCC